MNIEPSDHRRALALIVHHSRDDIDGINVTLKEAVNERRATQLVLSLLEVFSHLVVELRTQTVSDLITDHILRLAGLEDEGHTDA